MRRYTVSGQVPWSHWHAISTSLDPASLQACPQYLSPGCTMHLHGRCAHLLCSFVVINGCPCSNLGLGSPEPRLRKFATAPARDGSSVYSPHRAIMEEQPHWRGRDSSISGVLGSHTRQSHLLIFGSFARLFLGCLYSCQKRVSADWDMLVA